LRDAARRCRYRLAVAISLCCMSGGDPMRLAALLELCRDAVDEIVIALDDRVDPEGATEAVALADRVVRVPYAPPPERLLAWLYGQCGGDWILKLDDDEVPSVQFLQGLRDAADPLVTHVWYPRRCLFESEGHYLDGPPWVPDFQLRLSVNDDRLVHFPGVLHVPIEVVGPARYVDDPIYHLALLCPREERERKAAAYERERPGLRTAGLAFNHAYYLPELQDARLVPLPPEDRELVLRVCSGGSRSPGAAPVEPVRATREQIDAVWSRRGLEYAADLTVWSAPARIATRERAQIVVVVRNRGGSALPAEAVQVASRWDGGEPGLWTRLPEPVRPGAEVIAPVTVEAPGEPGARVVELDLVHEGVRRFGVPVHVPIEVALRRRVGILVREATRARGPVLAAAVVAARPDLEPVLVGVADGGGYATIAGPEERVVLGLAAGHRKLHSFVTAARRVRALRRDRGTLEVDGLVLAGLEATTLLERWTDLAATLLASDRGAPVLVPQPPAHRGVLDRLLLSRLVAAPRVRVGGDEVLTDFLADL
jgi:hypothetical protein